MIVQSISVEGFMAFKGRQTLGLGGRGAVGVAGLNGIGKSTIVSRALTWALYGKCAPVQAGSSTLTARGKDLINDDSKSCSVAVALEDRANGNAYEITRSRDRKSSDTITCAGPGAESTQEWIDSLIGAQYDIFVRTVVRGQGDPWNFPGATDGRKREILDVLSGALKLEGPYLRAKKIAQARASGMESHRRSVADAQRRMASLNVEELQGRAVAWEADRQNRVSQARGELSALQTALDLAQQTDAAQEANAATRRALESAAPTLDLQPYREAEQAAYRAVAGSAAQMQAARQAQHQAAQLLAAGKCPTCQKPIEPGDPIHNVAHVAISDSTHKLNEQQHQAAREAMRGAEAWLHNEQAAHRSRLAAVPPPSAPMTPAAQAAVTMAEQRIAEIEAAANPWAVQAEQAEGHRFNLVREIAVLEELVAMADREQCLAEAWMAALSPTGARAHLAEGTLAAIESEANRWLSVLSDGRITISFPPTKETKGGAVKDEIQTVIEIDGVRRPWILMGGGQHNRVNFACDLGIAAAFSRGGSLALSLLVIDEELLSGLDAPGKRLVIDALGTAGVADVVVIDHDPALIRSLARTIEVKAGPDGSVIEELT
jgi:DNA repair exonuclease SbcCD ATPase subunit